VLSVFVVVSAEASTAASPLGSATVAPPVSVQVVEATLVLLRTSKELSG